MPETEKDADPRSTGRGRAVVMRATRRVTAVDQRNRVLMLHPYTVWKVPPEQLALYMVGEATRLRLGRPFTRSRAATIRADRRVLQEVVACARILPHSEALAREWEK